MRYCQNPSCSNALLPTQNYFCCRKHRIPTEETRKRLRAAKVGWISPNIGSKRKKEWNDKMVETYYANHPILTLDEWQQTHPEDLQKIGQVAELSLTRGQKAIVDAEYLGFLSQFNWSASPRIGKGGWIALTMNRQGLFGVGKFIQLSRLIMNAPSTLQVDHINWNTLDNRRANLRLCTGEQNQRNRGANRNNKTGYKGVAPHHTGKFSAQLHVGKKKLHLGVFRTPQEAATAYDQAAHAIHKEFAFHNF